MNMFYYTPLIILPLIITYKWNTVTRLLRNETELECRFSEPNSYLNNLVNCVYFNAMEN
jgi:hypothetical protein